MRFWRSPHFKGRHRRANLTWSVCLGLRGFLFEVAGQLELSDFCHFDLFYFFAEMYTSILPTDARVEQVSLNGENENERARERRRGCRGWFVFNRNWRQGPFPGAAHCACWYGVEQTLSLGCPVRRPARVTNESHMWGILHGDPLSWSRPPSRSQPLSLISFLMEVPPNVAYLPAQIVAYFDVRCVLELFEAQGCYFQSNAVD